MKAKELRIGNFITAIGSLNPNENYLTVCGLNDTSIVTKYFSDIGKHWQRVVNKDNYAPIPLTEEWLIKFGLEAMDGWDDQIYYCSPKNQEFQVMLCNQGYEYDYTILKYVHQLQNLYYALTGEELTMTQQ